MNRIQKTVGMAALILLVAATSIKAQDNEEPRVESPPAAEESALRFGYNALENGYNFKTGQLRTRLLSNVEADVGSSAIGWSGMNQLDGDSYFGRNVLTVGKGKTKAALVTKGTQSGIFDAKVGLRRRLTNSLCDYGSIDVTVDRENENVALFCGNVLPKGVSVELYQDTEFGKYLSHWTEIQVNKSFGERAAIYGRIEMGDFKDPSYIFGFSLK